MGKSAFNQIDPVELGRDIGNDGLRYYLCRDVGLGSDGEFSYEGLVARYNSDLANNLGNLMSRVATVVGSKCGGIGPAPSPADSSRLAAVAGEGAAEAVAAWRAFAPQEALESTWRLIRAANAELEAVEPWKRDPGPDVDAVLGDAARGAPGRGDPELAGAAGCLGGDLASPGARGRGGGTGQCRPRRRSRMGGYPGGIAVEKAPPLFPRRSAE